MDLQAIELSELTPAQLDSFLAFGWFRIQQTIFTTEVLYFNGESYQPVWLRIDLEEFDEDKTYIALKKRNKNFTTRILQAKITSEHEELFARYREAVSFQTAQNLQWLLYGESRRNIYQTHMIEVLDGSKLIATGFFDLGNTSAAGISCFYDPSYKKYSLGRYMIFEKVWYCKENGYRYFYPGYFVPGFPLFDYKLEIGRGALHYFNVFTKSWLRLPFKQEEI